MKKVYFGILIIIVMSTFLFTLGVFHPKEIYIDDLKIEAPKNMILSRVTVDSDKNVHNYFSPLLLQNKNRFNLSVNKELIIDFSGANKYFGVPSIIVTIVADYTQEKFLKSFKDKNKYKEEADSKCLIYEDGEESILEIHAFCKTKKMMISILSSNKSGAHKILEQFCLSI